MRFLRLSFLALVAVVFGIGQASASPVRVNQMDDPGAFPIGGLKEGMSKEQARSVLGDPVKMTGQSWFYDQYH